jgi:hypothetical protein
MRIRRSTNSTTSPPSTPLHGLSPRLLLLVGLGGGGLIVSAQGQGRSLELEACIDSQGNLLPDTAVQDRTCMAASEAVFYYDIVPAPVTSNGLQAGAPTDLHLWFGSINNSLETAFDPNNFGLALPESGRLILDFGPQFIYDTAQARIPIPNQLVELGLAMGNAILGEPCPFESDADRAALVCGGWTAGFGAADTDTNADNTTNTKQVVYTVAPNQTQGITGERGRLIGAKFAHVHPQFGTASGLYHNANGTCSTNTVQYCRFDVECPDTDTCVTADTITAPITVTVVDGSGYIVHKAVRQVTFTTQPRFAVFPTNAFLFVYQELSETVDFQHVFPETTCDNLARVDGFFSTGAPYAPRFSLFGPQSSDAAFPHPNVSGLSYEMDNDNGTTGTLRNDTQVIGTVVLFQPAGAGGVLLMPIDNGVIGDGANVIGGTIFAVPVRVGSIPGLYTVRVTMVDGFVADSRIVVDEATESPTAGPSAIPSAAPSAIPSGSPSAMPSGAPSAIPSTAPSAIPSGAPSLSPSFGPTDSPSAASAANHRWHARLGQSIVAFSSAAFAFILL